MLSRILIRFYQTVGQAKHEMLWSVFGYSSVCKHQPSCSEYALKQIQEHGTIWGSVRAVARILTCW